MVATYATSTPPGVSASATTARFSHGASMSSTTRSTLPAGSATGSTSARAPTVSVQAGCGPSKNESTLPRATAAKSARRSIEWRCPVSPTARSSDMVSAPEPTPASTPRAPG